MGNKGCEYGPDVLADHEIGNIIEIGRLAIDNHQMRAISFCHQRKSGCGPHDQRGANRQEEVAAEREFLRATHGALRHRLSE